MTYTDAILALVLSARIHRSNAAIKATARRCARQLPRSKRDLMRVVEDSREPLRLVEYLAENLG